MYCRSCGSFIPEGQPNCPNCGTPCSQSAFQQPVVQPIQQAYEQSAYRQPVENNTPPVRRNGFAVAGLILGIVALCLCWVPILDIILGFIGLAFSIFGILKKNLGGKIISFVGLGLSVVAVIFSLVIWISLYNLGKDIDYNAVPNSTTTSVTTTVVTTTTEATQTSSTSSETSITTDSTTTIDKTKEREEFIASCVELDYKAVARNPKDYVGQNFYVVVNVRSARTGGLFTGYQKYFVTYICDFDKAKEYMKSGVVDEWSNAAFLASDVNKTVYLLDNRKDSDPYYVKILKDDVVVVYGTFTGLQSTKNSLTGETGEEVALEIKYVDILAE